jgi:hypothetical protein
MAPKHNTPAFSRRIFLEMGAVAAAALAMDCSFRKRGNWEFLTDDEAAKLKPASSV